MIAEYTARRQHCPTQAPKGLHLVTSEGKLTATLGTNVTFLVFLEEVSVFFPKEQYSNWLPVHSDRALTFNSVL